MEKYIRKCPLCNEIVEHINKICYKQALKRNSKCKKCNGRENGKKSIGLINSKNKTGKNIKCEECGRGYKIGPLELNLLKKMNLPVPHSCPQCRQKAHFSRLNPIHLWKRSCKKCNTEISTAFAPERPEVIYCEKCYQQEFN